MWLQDVLKERKGGIAHLEESLKASESKANGSATAPPVLYVESGDGEFVMLTGDCSDRISRSGTSIPRLSSPDSSGKPVSQDDRPTQGDRKQPRPGRIDQA